MALTNFFSQSEKLKPAKHKIIAFSSGLVLWLGQWTQAKRSWVYILVTFTEWKIAAIQFKENWELKIAKCGKLIMKTISNSRPLFIYSHIFYRVYSKINCPIKIADAWIQTPLPSKNSANFKIINTCSTLDFLQ